MPAAVWQLERYASLLSGIINHPISKVPNMQASQSREPHVSHIINELLNDMYGTAVAKEQPILSAPFSVFFWKGFSLSELYSSPAAKHLVFAFRQTAVAAVAAVAH